MDRQGDAGEQEGSESHLRGAIFPAWWPLIQAWPESREGPAGSQTGQSKSQCNSDPVILQAGTL